MVFPRYLGRALWFYEKCPTVFPCLQVIWQDDNRQFPWDAECDPDVIQESAAVEEDGVLRPGIPMPTFQRHCEERQRRSNPCLSKRRHGLLRFARNDEPEHLIQLSNSDEDTRQHPRGTTCPSLA
jgi:hypothetical protein